MRNEIAEVCMINPEVYKVRRTGGVVIGQMVRYLRANGFRHANEWLMQENSITRSELSFNFSTVEYDEIVIFDPGYFSGIRSGLRLLKNAGLEPPTEGHAIRLAEQYGKLKDGETHRKPYIVFLHKPWWQVSLGRGRHVMYVDRRSDEHRLGLRRVSEGFSDGCVLAGIRRVYPDAGSADKMRPVNARE